MQYTLRNVPRKVDTALRAKARREGKSLNQVAIEALAMVTGTGTERVRLRDLRDVAGTWEDDGEVARTLDEQRRIDTGMWSA